MVVSLRMFDYEKDPKKIEQDSFKQIRTLTKLSRFSQDEAQVAMRVVHSLGMPSVAQQLRFSPNACAVGRAALARGAPLLCDVEMVKQGITKRMIHAEPLCFLNTPATSHHAKQQAQTRTMAALQQWLPVLDGSIVLIGNAPTALFHLLELIAAGAAKPALIIGMPVGFIGAAESKQALWDHSPRLGLECITLLGREGGSAVTAASCNALLRCNLGEYY